MMQGLNPDGKLQMVKVDADGKLVVTGVSGGGGGTSTSDTTEVTQLAVKSAVEALNTKTPALESGRVPVALPTGLATETTATAALAELESLDAKTPDPVRKQVIDEASASLTYIGEAPLGTPLSAAAWRVRRISVAGTLTTIEFSPANSIFNNRASLGYT